ncbi:CU044_2847 family protein [Streptomyces monticola]|uniref:CU044_2847 family protein n=1 Tax=Streptomyces monticola TaxID=2666263 RepID=A0ABW2JR35_9ACTN
MNGLVEFRANDDEDAPLVLIAAADDDLAKGARLAARGNGPAQATRTFEDSLAGARAAAESALRVFRDGSLKPDGVEIEFGVKLTAEAGAVIAKTSVEGHLVVKLSWAPEHTPRAPGVPSPAPSPETGTNG